MADAQPNIVPVENRQTVIPAQVTLNCETNNCKKKSCMSSLCYILLISILISILYIVYYDDMQFFINKTSEFFSPPEDAIMNNISSKSTMVIPSIDVETVKDQFQENFDNDLPNQTNKIPTDGTNYADIAADMALEKSVKEQHKQYVNQREKYTGTASFNPERSDSQDLVTFVGLRRPSYLTKEGNSLVDSTARQVSSVVDPNTLSKPVNLSWNYGSFK